MSIRIALMREPMSNPSAGSEVACDRIAMS